MYELIFSIGHAVCRVRTRDDILREHGIEGLTDTGVSGTPGFAAGDFWEEDFELRVEQSDVLASENLCNKGPAWSEDMGCDVECCQEKLRLNVLVHVVKSRHL